jgi:predicted ATP-binding protein involved in virulence
MHIHSLHLRQYRAALDLELQFHDRMNVFVGVNGAGKSTVLSAISIMLSWLVNRIKGSTSGRPIDEDSITKGKAFTFASIQLNLQASQDQHYAWSLVKTKSGSAHAEHKSQLAEVHEYAKLIQENLTSPEQNASIPLFVYYPVNRAVLDIPLRIRDRHRFTTLSAYDEALTSGANFRTFFEWFREREDLENEARRDQTFSPDKQLEAVRRALYEFLPQFSNLTVRRNPLRMEVSKNGKPLEINQLSDGEKCVIALIGDLARRLAIANPGMNNSLHGAGVVIIDEVDLHLHPSWQQMLIPQLLSTFTGCQFFLSTHSPHVITHAKSECIFLIEQTEHGIEARKPVNSYGKTVDRVLEDFMGLTRLRPHEVEVSLRKIYETIANGLPNLAREKIAELERVIGSDPDLVKAEVLIRRKEMIGR